MSQKSQVMSHCLWVKDDLIDGIAGDRVRVVTEPTLEQSHGLSDAGWRPVTKVFGPADVNKQLGQVARDALDRGDDVKLAVERHFKVKAEPVGDDGRINPKDVKKVIDRLNDTWIMASNQMNGAGTDEAAREWAARMREAEYAQTILRRLIGGE